MKGGVVNDGIFVGNGFSRYNKALQRMQISEPTYLIAELKGDVTNLILGLREKYSPAQINWPTDITIAGSSGLGTIREGQDLNSIVELLAPILKKHPFREIKFTSVKCFSGTGIYYLEPSGEKFVTLHNAVADSGVLFHRNKWPYRPHCTLRSGAEATEKLDQTFKQMTIPKNTEIDCFSLYQPRVNGGLRIHQF